MTVLNATVDPSLARLVGGVRERIASRPAQQQPTWEDADSRQEIVSLLAASTPLVSEGEVLRLREGLANVAQGQAVVLQAGDCAEPITDTADDVVDAKVHALAKMEDALQTRSGQPVVKIGRIGGQFAKPRSQTHEVVSGSSLPTYRGALVNDPFPSARARRHEPERMLRAHAAAAAITGRVRSHTEQTVWTSHEALVLDYETPLLRTTTAGEVMLSSAHTVWIGARTNQADHAHVELASRIINPVGCKVTAFTTEESLSAIAQRIDPARQDGKLMLIARMGDSIDRLPALMRTLQQEGYKPIWMSDPMHANTVTASDGRKTRYMEAITRELTAFQDAAASEGVHAGGVHLETTIDAVRECLGTSSDLRDGHAPYTSLCDPRLTLSQAIEVLNHWKIRN
ncbi:MULTISPECIES: 3-deoxy-7-phosphoheptulonate synthase [unclassified Microbacterium]|uniref:3-deoxy-7-phosphoheptulonate synthase n=1 Tax=unclassified Microbacterium TaxID=2609290 RepID=UPI0009EE3129|nr:MULTISPECIES: 3-deoxy-7-phosphoheptulonate synthase [unclassified Microbacterium]MCJ2194764.1 3-deoxy-7-phosphoheptulonate synthase [Kaistella montana]NYF30417.1 3-deoxy-7-phosphoheptulonate synthase [Microbacterium sp. JAI119]